MTEEIKPTETEVNEEVDTQEPTVSVAEMKRRLDKKEKDYQEQLDNLKTEQAKAIAEALDRYKKESELTGKELEKFKQQQAEAEKQKLLDQIAEYQRNETRRELKDEAIKTLSSRKLPVNDKVLNFVVKDTADETTQAIEDMAEIITDIKNQFVSSEAPISSGGLGNTESSINDDPFKKAKITKY